LILLYFHANSLSIWNTLYFVPYIILSRIVVPLAKTNKNKLGTKLAALSNSYTYFYTYIRMLTKGVPAWQPTGVRVTKLHEDFVSAFNIGTFISVTFISGFLFVLFSRPEIFGNYNTYVVLAWTFYSVFWHGLFLTFVLKYIHPYRMENVRNSFGKLFISAKTYSVPALCFVLSGFAVFNFTAAAFNPETPTRKVVASLMEGEIPVASAQPIQLVQSESLVQAQPPAPESSSEPLEVETTVVKPNTKVLAVQTTIEPEKIKYTFTIEKGDTQLKLATRATQEYLMKNNMELTQKQVNYASAMVVKNSANRKALRVGQEISFEEEIIIKYVEMALTK
jgi:hypothetical protein